MIPISHYSVRDAWIAQRQREFAEDPKAPKKHADQVADAAEQEFEDWLLENSSAVIYGRADLDGLTDGDATYIGGKLIELKGWAFDLDLSEDEAFFKKLIFRLVDLVECQLNSIGAEVMKHRRANVKNPILEEALTHLMVHLCKDPE